MAGVIWQHPDWTKEERPILPGSPATLRQSLPARAGFAAVGVFVGLVGNLGNALVIANLPEIQGNLALTPVQGQWLSGAYIMVSCWSNLLLFKFRMQFGVRAFAQIGLIAYASLCLLQVFVNDYSIALAARAASGMAAAACSALASLYLIQCAGPGNVPRGAMVGISITQFATPIAYIVVPGLIDLGDPGLQYAMEAGLALCALAAVFLYPLPYSERVAAFEWRDAIAIALLAPGLALLVAVLTEGRLQWWTDKAWIGWALAASLTLLTAGAIFESQRERPLVNVRWIMTPNTLLFAAGALFIRFLTIEQQVGVVALLRIVGMGPDQLAPFYWVVLTSQLFGLVLVIFFANPKTMRAFIAIAVFAILIGCLLDRTSTPQDRPHDFYVSQALVGFGTLIFLGPLLFLGLSKIIKDLQNAVTLVVLFTLTQSVGLLLGNAALGTFQQFREHEWSAVINAGVDPTNPVVQQRLALQGRVYQSVLTDPTLRTAAGTAQLAQSATLNATVQAYNDVFLLMASLAVLFLIWMGVDALVRARRPKDRVQTVTGPTEDGSRAPQAPPPLVDGQGRPLDPHADDGGAAPPPSTDIAKPEGGNIPGQAAGDAAPEPGQRPTDSGPEPKAPKPSRITIVVMALVGAIGVLIVLAAWRLPPFNSPIIATQDAYVMGRVTVMAPEVSGYIVAVLAADYQFVRAGQPLVKIDDRIYRQQLAQAQGQLDLAIANLDRSVQTVASDRAQLASLRADLQSAAAERVRAALDASRLDELAARGSVSAREREQGDATLLIDRANEAKAVAAIRVGQETIKSDLVAREGLGAQVETARAQVSLAKINLDNTVIYAPHDGQIGDFAVRRGQYVAAGSQIVYFVPPELWVIANFKETQTRDMLVGQPATIAVDALGGHRLTARVEVFAPATGSQFSVLRSDNATGNFTKIVQRIPIRLRIDPGQPFARRLRPGLSVTARVDTAGGGRDACVRRDPAAARPCATAPAAVFPR